MLRCEPHPKCFFPGPTGTMKSQSLMLGLEKFKSSQCRACQQTGIQKPATLEPIKCPIIQGGERLYVD